MSETPPPTRLRPASVSAPWTTAVTVLLGWACGASRSAIRRCAVCIAAALLSTVTARASEVCHFAGTTDYSGRIEVTTNVNARVTDETSTVDVTVYFTATPWPLVHIRYLMQEVTTLKSGQLQSVATNSRDLVDDHIGRQIWDLFDRGTDGLEAYRLQGKTLDDFRRKYPAFVRHWDAANVGQPWIQDYRLTSAERRPDLDLPASSVGPDLRSPLALAFYWSRWIPRSGQAATVFLPGFKKDKRLDLTIGAAEPSRDGQQRAATAWAALSLSSQVIARSAPASASATAIAAPIPCWAPVTSAILPANIICAFPVASKPPRSQDRRYRGERKPW